MKVVFQSVLYSIGIHLLYFVGSWMAGFIKTITYKPDPNGDSENVTYLQKEVAYGFVGSPFTFVYTVIGLAVLLLLLKFRFMRWRRARSSNV